MKNGLKVKIQKIKQSSYKKKDLAKHVITNIIFVVKEQSF